jgi:tRNA (cytosine38-C5)-methyltransferase
MTTTPTPTNATPRALEFYCGVGGLHYALLRARPDATVAAAFDLNPHACDTYAFNFGDAARPIARNLASYPAASIDAHAASLWLLSPPCQPFTRQGAKRDVDDGRAESFLRLLDVVPTLANAPSHLLVENVVGFERSETRDALLATLRAMGYTTRERMLSPRQFGVPYSRPRYFCLAKRAPLRWVDDVFSGIGTAGADDDSDADGPTRSPPPSALSDPKHWIPKAGGVESTETTDVPEVGIERTRDGGAWVGGGAGRDAAAAAAADADADATTSTTTTTTTTTTARAPETRAYPVAPLSCFLEHGDDDEGADEGADVWTTHAVPRADVVKALASADVVTRDDRKCNCFTKSYGKYVKGTGSFISDVRVVKGEWDGRIRNGQGADVSADDGGGGVRLRYFTEREVANVHSFPPEFTFPSHVTRAQRYALLGNSLSVACVAPLIDYLLNDV